MDTYFAPAQRTERRKFENQITDISQNPIMDSVLKSAAGLLVVLNEDRQIVAINPAFLEALGVEDIQQILGFRLGETLHCAHAFEKPNGCGTTEHCISCGAAIAMMSAISEDKPLEKICALLTDKNGQIEDTCLLVKAMPITLDQHRWILIYAQDITRQHFWTNLERVFFHDINNLLTAVYGNVQLLESNDAQNEEIAAVQTGVEKLIREIQLQKTFSQRKQPGNSVSITDTSLKDIQKEIKLVIGGHASSHNKTIIEEWPLENSLIKTDILLVSRVLGNMIINALEASKPGESIKMIVRDTGTHIAWEVWNPSPIPVQVQKRVFQRHFSTKKDFGRGLGTYSMKLFGESFLKGKVSFSSTPEKGTCFTFTLPKQQTDN